MPAIHAFDMTNYERIISWAGCHYIVQYTRDPWGQHLILQTFCDVVWVRQHDFEWAEYPVSKHYSCQVVPIALHPPPDIKSRSLLPGVLCLRVKATTLGVKVQTVCVISSLVRIVLRWPSQCEKVNIDWNTLNRSWCNSYSDSTNLICDFLHLVSYKV